MSCQHSTTTSSSTNTVAAAALASSEAQDRLVVLFHQEMSFYQTSDYLGALIHKSDIKGNMDKESSSSSSSKMLNQHWREVMTEWAYHGKLLLMALLPLLVPEKP